MQSRSYSLRMRRLSFTCGEPYADSLSNWTFVVIIVGPLSCVALFYMGYHWTRPQSRWLIFPRSTTGWLGSAMGCQLLNPSFQVFTLLVKCILIRLLESLCVQIGCNGLWKRCKSSLKIIWNPPVARANISLHRERWFRMTFQSKFRYADGAQSMWEMGISYFLRRSAAVPQILPHLMDLILVCQSPCCTLNKQG